MYPVYKKVKVLKPHCPKDGQPLSGDNSVANPWECRCGIWKHKEFGSIDYEIIPTPICVNDETAIP